MSSLSDDVQNLKLRASYGNGGSNETDSYEWLFGYNYSFFYAINETAIPTIDNKRLPNPVLSWENISTFDVGLDFSVLEEDLSFSFDYFYRIRTGVLATPRGSIPNTLGVGIATQNLHEYSNKGFEISANYKKTINSDLDFSIGLNYSRSREKAVFIDEAPYTDDFQRANLTQTGDFTGLRYGYISDGLFQSQEEIDAHPIQDGGNNSTLQAGDIKYVDLNNDDVIDNLDRKVYSNGGKAASNYSFNLGANYKNLSLSMLFTGAFGYDIFLEGEARSPLTNGFNGYTYQLDYWTPENTDAAYPRIAEGGANDNNYRESDFWTRDGKHLRLKNVTLRYTIPSSIKVFSSFDEVSVFCTGYNLFVLKTYKEEFDPQMSTGTGWYYPQIKSFTFGMKVSI